MFRSRFPLLAFGLALAACAGGPLVAAPADPDFETAVPAHAPPVIPPPSSDPPGLVGSPLVVTGKATGPHLRFVMRDGTVLVGQVLAFDGQMYALRLPHSTLLARKDLFTSVEPVTAPPPKRRTARVASGARS